MEGSPSPCRHGEPGFVAAVHIGPLPSCRAPRALPQNPEQSALRTAITERLNAHDLLGVMDHGSPEDEYDPEMEEFAALMAVGVESAQDTATGSRDDQ